VALTDEAKEALGGAPEVPLMDFPVRFGRERRSPEHKGASKEERRLGTTFPLNEVYLHERHDSTALHISGVHFVIERSESGFFLVDRGSACGTIVAGTRVGAHRVGGRALLRDGDEVIVGTHRSRYIFRFSVASGAAR